MAITKQDYLQKLPTLAVSNTRMMGKITNLSNHLRDVNDQDNKELMDTVSVIQEGLLFLSLQATAENVTDENYKRYMEAFDKLPSVMHTEIKPSGKTVFDYFTEGMSADDATKFQDELKDFYNNYELTITKNLDQLKAQEAEAKKQLDLERNGNPLDVIPEFPEERKTGPKITAAKWIENAQSAHASYHNFTMTTCSEIMAARLLADSDRGYKDKLEAKELHKSEVEDTARWLRDNCDFEKFFRSNRKKIFDASRSGHGGGIDDLFKSHIKKLPAGAMPTRGLYTRYMPTARERIDELKKQIKAGKDPVTAAAEIVALRNLVKAEQGQKTTLDRKLNPEQMQKLHDQVQLLSKDPSFKAMVTEDPTARTLLTKGHGGDFLAHIRNSEKNYPNMNKDAVAVLNASTLGARMEELKKSASEKHRELQEELDRQRDAGDNRNMEKTWKMIGETKELLAEYIACDNLSRKPIKGQVNKEQRLLQDVPQTKIDEQVRNRDQNPAFNNLVGNINPLKAIDILNGMASKQPDEFMRDLADSNNKQVQNEHKVSVPAKDTKVIEGNNQIVPTV